MGVRAERGSCTYIGLTFCPNHSESDISGGEKPGTESQAQRKEK